MPTNTVIVIGRLTRAPELNYVGDNNTPVASLRIAVNRMPVNGAEQDPNYFDVTAWGAQAQRCDEYLVRGQQIGVTGELRSRQWTTDDGSKRTAVEIVAHNVEFLAKPGGRDQVPADSDAASPTFAPAAAGTEIPA